MCGKGTHNGKKQMAVRTFKQTLEIIHLLTDKNPLDILFEAIVQGGAREDSTRIGSGGTVRRQAVDVSPLRRVNQAIYLICKGAREAAFRTHKLHQFLRKTVPCLFASSPVSMAMSYHALQDNDEGESNVRRCKLTTVGISFVLMGMSACMIFGQHGVGVLQLHSPAVLKPPSPPAYLEGWSRQMWMTCTATHVSCPLAVLDTPHEGCISTIPPNRMLLTADGLSSPHVQEAFQRVLESTAAARTRGHNPADKSIVLVLDAAYDAYKVGTQKTSALSYCYMRKAELKSLGASSVTCVVLDVLAREDLWRTGESQGGRSKVFGDAMRDMDDNYLFKELSRASAVFVECGSPTILVQNFRRRLKLSNSESHVSFGDLVRSRVQGDADALAYVGVSSGSSIAGERILELSPADALRLGGDTSGLGLVHNCSFYPHASLKDLPLLHRMARTFYMGVMAIPNCQPLIDTGSLSRICP